MVASLASPLLAGVYEDGVLTREIRSEEHASEGLVRILRDFKFEINGIIYANGPGSFMGLKVAYVILRTFCLAKNIKFESVSGFELNGGAPIRANKAFCFARGANGEINLVKAQAGEFKLPRELSNLNRSEDVLPNYVIGAV